MFLTTRRRAFLKITAGVRDPRRVATCLQGIKISALVCPVPMAHPTKLAELVALQYRLLPWSKML
jgi:hypothetical protein